MAQVVLSDVDPDAGLQRASLFQGIKFWLSQKVPQRSRFVNDVRANGGEILPIEKHANVKIVDHARKEVLPGTHSYTFIEKSVQNGTLEDLEDHKVGPPQGTVRSVGSIIHVAKATRNKYTQDDDRILWNWVHDNPQKGGGTDGNEIYKQLEAKHPQHPWQSWRDRWIKQLKGRPRPFPLPHNAPPTPPSDAPASMELPTEPQTFLSTGTEDFDAFSEEDAEALLEFGDDIMDIPAKSMVAAFEAWANGFDVPSKHSAQQWQSFWEENVRAQYLKRKAKQTVKTTPKKDIPPRAQTSTPLRRHSVASQSSSSPFPKGELTTRIRSISPSRHPESPSMQLIDPSLYIPKNSEEYATRFSSPIHTSQPDSQLAENIFSTIDENLKRKRAVLEEEVPSSSPLGIAPSPKRHRSNGTEPIREIASTPDRSPIHYGKRPGLPLFIEGGDDEEEKEEESDPEKDVHRNGSPLGKQPSDTLSEPRRRTGDTQAVFEDATQQTDFIIPLPGGEWDDEDPFLREPTQQIDFALPPPEEGWDDEDTGAEASSESESTSPEIDDPQPVRQQTQAIFRGKTPAPDLDVADPEGGWDHVIPSSPAPLPSSPAGASETSDVEAQTEAWINAHVAEGISLDDVIAVLKSTSMDTSLAENLLKDMGKRVGAPENMRGVWTETDDEDLGSTDARKIQRLESKHGKDCLTARWEFLSFYGAA